MENKHNQNPAEELMQAVYKNVKMGEEAVTTVIGKTKDAGMRQELTNQLESCYSFETAAKNKLFEMSAEAKKVGMIEKIPADLSIRMSTMMDSSNSKIAEIMIGGYNMGIVDLQKSINQARSEGVSDDVLNIATGLVEFEQGSIENMKQYL